MRRFFILFLVAFSMVSCNDNQANEKNEFDAIFAEVMKIHDDVMPETNNLYKLKKFAQGNIAVLPDTSSFIKKLLDVQLKSERADDAMMIWMEEFKIPESDHQTKIKYLEGEKESIAKVRDLMLNTIYQGKIVIKESDQFIKKNNLRDEGKTILAPAN